MARLYKPHITRYVGPDGKRCKKGDPGARKKSVKSKTWQGEYRDLDGIEHDVKLCTNKDASRRMLHELEAQALSGQNSRFAEASKTSLPEHLKDYRRHLESKGDNERHIKLTVSRCRSIIEGCRFRRIGDLNPSRVPTGSRTSGMRMSSASRPATAIWWPSRASATGW